jgi:small-conductance mechanosensitive channel
MGERSNGYERVDGDEPEGTPGRHWLLQARDDVVDAGRAVATAAAIERAAARRAQRSADPRAQDAWWKAQERLSALQRRLSQAQARVAREQTRLAEASHWEKELRAITRGLMEQYEGLGYQYEILVERAAHATLRAKQADARGEDEEGGEWRARTKMVGDLIERLQKYTESTKQEVISKQVQERVVVLIRMIEEWMSPRAPELLSELMTHLDERVPNRN